MKKPLLVVPALALLFFGCSFYVPLVGSGDLVEVQMSYTGFTVIDVNAPFDVTVIHGAEHGITIMVDDNVLDHVQIAQIDENLSMNLDSDYSYNNVTLKAVITVPVLEGLELSAAATVAVIDSASLPRVSSFRVIACDASRLLIGSIVADTASIRVENAGMVTITAIVTSASIAVENASSLHMNGSADDLTLVVANASKANLRDFFAREASTTISNASEAWVNIDGTLRPDITGASSLYYHGDVMFESPTITGASSIIEF